MATSKPSVVTYLKSSTYERLVEFKDAQHLRSLSQAVEVILDEYFGGPPPTNSPTQSIAEPALTLAERVDRLTANYEFLNQSILTLQQTLLRPIPSSSSSATVGLRSQPCFSEGGDQLTTEQSEDSNLEEVVKYHSGLTGTALALRLNVCPSTVSRRRSKPSFQNWSRYHDPEGIAWMYSKDTRYYPAGSKN